MNVFFKFFCKYLTIKYVRNQSTENSVKFFLFIDFQHVTVSNLKLLMNNISKSERNYFFLKKDFNLSAESQPATKAK